MKDQVARPIDAIQLLELGEIDAAPAHEGEVDVVLELAAHLAGDRQ